jgi:hypothetical protein
MRSKANLYRINPDFIISWGESAGGNLASMLGILNTRSSSMGLSQYSSKTQVVVNEFGPQDLTRAEYQNNPIMKSFLDKYIGYTFVQRPDLYRAASPFYQANTASAPLLTVSGNSDTDVPMADLVAMQQKLNSLGRVTETKIFQGSHNFIEPLEGSGQSGPVRQAEFSFVRNRTAGNLCQANAKTISQAVWINNLAYVRSVPVNLATKKPNWGNASDWVGPVAPDGLIPGSGPVNTDDIFIYPSAKKLIQSFWRSGEGYSREVPLKTDGTPDWNAAEPWPANPISANVYPPFSGEMQVSDSLLIGRGDTILQSYWRNNSGYIRYVAVDFFGHPAWNFTSEWTGPVSSSGLPGTATKPITAQTSIVYPDGTTLLQSFWRSDEGFTRTVPLNSLGYPDWNRAGQWSAGQISDLPVTRLPLMVTGMSMYYSDCN